MRPLPCARMCGSTAFVMRITPKTLTLKMRWACSTELSSAAPAEPMPVVDQDIDSSEPLDHALDDGSHGLVAGDVEIDQRDSVMGSDSRGVAAGPNHLETRVGEREGGRLPDSRGCSRHESHRSSGHCRLLI